LDLQGPPATFHLLILPSLWAVLSEVVTSTSTAHSSTLKMDTAGSSKLYCLSTMSELYQQLSFVTTALQMLTVSWVGHINVTNKMTGSRQLSDTTITSHPNRTCLQTTFALCYVLDMSAWTWFFIHFLLPYHNIPSSTPIYTIREHLNCMFPWFWVLLALTVPSHKYTNPSCAIINLYNHQHSLHIVTKQ
jgi:hypothetical protein